ncbi:MAG TPA: GAF domain-containing sensor histidine kinase [Nannocystis exedens]|nr:GAF domain-containing sensor histidine kinase [Nannocystis exedens]
MADSSDKRTAPAPLTLAEVAGILDCSRVALFFAEEKRLPRLASEAWPPPRHFDAIALDLCERVWLSREVNLLSDGSTEHSFAAAPLLIGTQLFGVLLALRSTHPPFTADDGDILVAMAERIALDRQRHKAQELARAEQAASAANRAKSAFLAHISHEIRTPLNAIIGYSELLEDELMDDGHRYYVSDIHRIQGAAQHLLTLINNMLDLTKIEAGKMELFLELVLIDELIADAVTTCRPVVERNGNVLRVSIDPTLAHSELRCDRLKLTQILINLLSNAGKFTQDGEIHLEATAEGDESYTLQVIDNGIGMTDQQIARIFSDYTQASESIASHYGGTGLGLAVTRRLCELMGGSIEVESTPNCGSTFRVRMPTHTDPTDPVESSLQR